ncbi:2-oxo acid dehydrogenase subunit E2 [Emcibacter sp.]
MTGGSFTVSNLGLRRIHYFTPILNKASGCYSWHRPGSAKTGGSGE